MNRLLFPFLFLTFHLSAQNFTSYHTGDTNDAVTNAFGGSCLMGGATENDSAMVWFLKRANGGDVLVFRATGSNGYNNYMFNLPGVNLNSVETIVFNSAAAASESYIHDKISKAEAIWFAGGNQWTYINEWRNTAIDSLINIGIAQRNLAIGGTSAGMAILGDQYFSAQNGTVTSNQALSNPYLNNVTIDSNAFLELDFMSNVITDTHFDNPNRKGRLSTFLARIATDYGIEGHAIACDEYTAVCIDDQGLARVYGEFPQEDDNAYFIQTNCGYNNFGPEVCQPGSPLTWNLNSSALKVYQVKGTMQGTNTFDLTDWETGSGGTWRHWRVQNGSFNETSGFGIDCTLNYDAFLIGDSNDAVTNPQGGVCMMGGAAESDSGMVWFLERANGGDVLVLRASGGSGYNDYMYNQLGVTLNSVETIVFDQPAAVNEAYIQDKISKAEAIWFAGGNQWTYVNEWRGTAIDSLVNEAIVQRNIVIGGTSAGMAILGDYYFTAQNGTLTTSQALSNPYFNRVTIDSTKFLHVNYLSNVITDTHFDNPDRKGRITTFLARIITDYGVVARGIACDERTAVCIDENGLAKVFGNHPSQDDNAYFIQTNCGFNPNGPEVCQIGSSLTWNLDSLALKVYQVKGTESGTNFFDLNDWESGSGGTWQHWSAQDGVFYEEAGNGIDCTPYHTSYFLGDSNDIVSNPTGGLCIMGGGVENDSALTWFLNRADNGDVLVLRTNGNDVYNDYFFNQLGVSLNSVETIVLDDAEAVNDTYIQDKISKAEAIWIAGADPWEFINEWRGTAIDSLINSAIVQRNIAIGGTSAGMSILGDFYFTAQQGVVSSSEALNDPYLSEITIDSTHFIQANFMDSVIIESLMDNPDKKGRLSTFLARIVTDFGIHGRAIACDEFTTVCVDNQGFARVFGSFPNEDDNAYFIQTNCAFDTLGPEVIQAGLPLTWNLDSAALKVYQVKGTVQGTNSFDLRDWETGVGGEWYHWSVHLGEFYEEVGDSINCDPPVASSVSNEYFDAKIKLFPNPVKDELTLDISQLDDADFTFSLMNQVGQILRTKTSSSKNEIIFNLTDIPSGYYLLNVESQHKTSTYPIMKL